jgi:predicted transcriptional regulator
MDMGGVALETMGQVMEFAKLMAVSGAAVPMYLRGNPGACLAICSRALRWRMDPFAVAEKSYMVVNKGEERIAYEAQLVHAVITARAPLKQRLRIDITGDADERRCKVSGTFKGEDRPHEYTSQTLGVMLSNRPKRRDGNGYGGSPLWDTNPEVQLSYSTVRQWCRLHASEVLLGVYTPDELEDGSTVDVTPPPTPIDSLKKRLQDAKKTHVADGRGFDAEHVSREASARSSIIEGVANPVDAEKKEVSNVDVERRGDEPDAEGRKDAAPDRTDDAGDAVGGEGVLAAGRSHVNEPAGEEAARAEGSGEEAGGKEAVAASGRAVKR